MERERVSKMTELSPMATGAVVPDERGAGGGVEVEGHGLHALFGQCFVGRAEAVLVCTTTKHSTVKRERASIATKSRTHTLGAELRKGWSLEGGFLRDSHPPP